MKSRVNTANRVALSIVASLWVLLFVVGMGSETVEQWLYHVFVTIPSYIPAGIVAPMDETTNFHAHLGGYQFKETSPVFWYLGWLICGFLVWTVAGYQPNLQFKWPRFIWIALAYALMILEVRGILIVRIASLPDVIVAYGVLGGCAAVVLLFSRQHVTKPSSAPIRIQQSS
ncbi:MAG: hypothetical protein KF784_15465 [Fimbriimonadaceae bacterium]|nr:hypothetical protein [Fimbriimonadaceae bacterium]